MIQATGTIVGSNGIAEYKNSQINVNYTSSDKFIGTVVMVEVGEKKKKLISHYENGQLVETEVEYWTKADTLLSFNVKEANPDFLTLQDEAIKILEESYPTVQFEFIKK